MKAVRYDAAQKAMWDDTVGKARNATFLFGRDYMDYHKERFDDCSLMFYDNRSRCTGCLPACHDHTANCIVSHGGLTYGGLLVPARTSYAEVQEMLETAVRFYRENGAETLLYKPVPHIYHRYPSEEDLYWLFRNGAKLYQRAISTTVDLRHPMGFSTLRKRKVNLAVQNGLTVAEATGHDTASLYAAFWTILTDVLAERHATRPVHTIDEILLLHRAMAGKIRLFVVKDGSGTVTAGCVAYITGRVVHIQYIAANAKGRACGALDLLFSRLITAFADSPQAWLDFGISTENGGKILNEGLLFQKEGFGGRAVCYDTYILSLDKMP